MLRTHFEEFGRPACGQVGARYLSKKYGIDCKKCVPLFDADCKWEAEKTRLEAIRKKKEKADEKKAIAERKKRDSLLHQEFKNVSSRTQKYK